MPGEKEKENQGPGPGERVERGDEATGPTSGRPRPLTLAVRSAAELNACPFVPAGRAAVGEGTGSSGGPSAGGATSGASADASGSAHVGPVQLRAAEPAVGPEVQAAAAAATAAVERQRNYAAEDRPDEFVDSDIMAIDMAANPDQPVRCTRAAGWKLRSLEISSRRDSLMGIRLDILGEIEDARKRLTNLEVAIEMYRRARSVLHSDVTAEMKDADDKRKFINHKISEIQRLVRSGADW